MIPSIIRSSSSDRAFSFFLFIDYGKLMMDIEMAVEVSNNQLEITITQWFLHSKWLPLVLYKMAACFIIKIIFFIRIYVLLIIKLINTNLAP